MDIKEHEEYLEKRIKKLDEQLFLADEGKFCYDDVRREASDLKHQLWQSRL